jgi:predicted dehydrogenase
VDKTGRIDHVTTQYHYPEGPSVHAEASWLLTQGFNMGYTLHCEKGTVDFDMARGPAALTVLQRGQSSQTIQLKPSDGYTAEIRYFVDCIARNSPPETVTARDAVAALEICEAEEESLRNNGYTKILTSRVYP